MTLCTANGIPAHAAHLILSLSVQEPLTQYLFQCIHINRHRIVFYLIKIVLEELLHPVFPHPVGKASTCLFYKLLFRFRIIMVYPQVLVVTLIAEPHVQPLTIFTHGIASQLIQRIMWRYVASHPPRVAYRFYVSVAYGSVFSSVVKILNYPPPSGFLRGRKTQIKPN